MDVTQIAALTSASTALVTVALTKGIDALLRLRKARAEECHYEDELIDKNYKFVIQELKDQIASLRKDLEAERVECAKIQGEMRGLIAELENAMIRHDDNNRKQVEVLRAEIDRMERGEA